MKLVVGIDPGNERSGVSFWVDGELRWSMGYSPWDKKSRVPALPYGPVQVYVEVPLIGAKKTMAGISFAAGMVVADLSSFLSFSRKDVHKVQPRDWRKALGLPLKGPKDPYIEAALEWDPDVGDDHDRAEAVLIGRYGCVMEGYE